MDYQQALGQILRELRVSAGLSREACAGVLNRDHLAKIEQGRQAITLMKFKALCDLLSVSPSEVMFSLEARLIGLPLDEYQVQWVAQLHSNSVAGRLHSEAQVSAARGVRGKRADETRDAVRRLQKEAMSKMEVVRELGIARSTVDRYWLKD